MPTGDEPTPAEVVIACDLCRAEVEPGARRCPTCGLYRGGVIDVVAATRWRMAGAFVAVYVLTILVVLLAR